MPGLAFENLPKVQNTPHTVLSGELHNLQNTFLDREKALKRQYLTDVQYTSAIQNLQGEYDSQKMRITKAQNQLKSVQKFIDQGLITPEAGQEAMWRLVLPPETQRAMFQKPEEQPSGLGTPYSITEIEKIEKEAEKFAAKAKWEEDPWLTWRDIKKPRSQKKLITQYKAFRNKLGYDYMKDQAKKHHIDNAWDAVMKRYKGYAEWNPEDPEIKALRSYGGKLSKAIAKNISPLAQSIIDEKPKEKSIPTALELEEQDTPESFKRGQELGYW